MSDTKVFEFTPNEACETGATVAGGVQKVLDDSMQGNLYVVVVTS